MKIPELYEIQKQFINDCSFAIENNKIGIFSSPTGTGKTLSLLLSLKNFISEINEDDENFIENILCGKIVNSKIFYCSRTHSQLRQVVNEFKKVQICTRGIVLGSRKGYCVNNEVNKLSSVELINSKCRELVSENRCKYYVEHYKDKGIYSIEDLVKDSRNYNYCPYYFSKEYFKRSEIVFLPYNMLFNEDTRKSLDINLDNSIVIVDEAHNIIDTVSQINTALIQIEDLKRYVVVAEKYKKALKEGSKNSNLINLILEIVRRIVFFYTKLSKDKILEVSDFLLETNLHNFNTLEITEEIKKSRLMLKLENYEKKTNLKLEDITKFLKLLVASDKSSRIECGKGECGKGFFKIFPLNSKIFFDSFKNTKSVIFAGGTMEPIDELKGIFNHRDVVYYNYQSNKRKFRGFIINKVYDKDIEIKQTTRDDSQLFSNLNKMVLEISNSKLEGGTVVFLPSKYYLDIFRSFFKSHEELACFYEDKDKFEEFVISVRRTKSILFAVIGGTYSEGVNFSDELCRNLIIIGVPYPNLDNEINEKIKFFGFEWYTQVAMKKVNQTIGRAIRHDDDYANIFLVDKRYIKLKKYLSNWILNKIEINNFENILQKSKEFLLNCKN